MKIEFLTFKEISCMYHVLDDFLNHYCFEMGDKEIFLNGVIQSVDELKNIREKLGDILESEY